MHGVISDLSYTLPRVTLASGIHFSKFRACSLIVLFRKRQPFIVAREFLHNFGPGFSILIAGKNDIGTVDNIADTSSGKDLGV